MYLRTSIVAGIRSQNGLGQKYFLVSKKPCQIISLRPSCPICLKICMQKNTNIIQFSSVSQLCPTLCEPMNRSTPGLPIHHQLLEFIQTHIHRVSDAPKPSYPVSSPSPPAPNPSQHQGLFQRVNSSHEVAKVLEFQLQHLSFQWTPRTDLL